MSDPVAQYLSKYRPPSKPVDDPVERYVSTYPNAKPKKVAPIEDARRKREQEREESLRKAAAWIGGQVRGAGSSLAEQGRSAINDPVGTAKGLASALYHSVDDPLQTIGKGLRYPLTRKDEDVVSPGEMARAGLMLTALKTTGPAGQAAIDVSAPIVSRVGGAIARRLGDASGRAVETGLQSTAKHAGSGAAFMVGADPDHPIKATLEGAVVGAVLGKAGEKVGAVGKATAERGRTITSAIRETPKATLDPVRRYIERYGKAAVPTSQSPQASTPIARATAEAPGQINIQRVPVDQIKAKPELFQYKRGGDTNTGAGSELKGLTAFDEKLGGVLSIWRDPSNNELIAVNGHHRLELARRTGHPSVNAMILDAKTPAEARTMGALQNISEGRGTAIDAAQFFRETGLGVDELKDRVSFRGPIAKNGVALSKLAPDLFDRVAKGEVSEGIGAAIGDMLPSPELQRTALSVIDASGKRLSEAEVREVARQVRDAGTEQVKQETLFGSETQEVPLYVERAQLAAAIQKRLSADRRLFGFVSKDGRAEGLARAGNQIDVEASRRIADESAQLGEVFSTLYTRKGPIADALTQAARRIANGEKAGGFVDELYPAIRAAVSEAYTGRKGAGNPERGSSDQDGRPASGEGGADELRGLEEGRVPDSTDPNQAGLLSPDGTSPRTGPERSGADGPLFTPEQAGPDLFGRSAARSTKGDQGSLLDERAGTEASRPLTGAERAARGEVSKLRQVLALETDPARRAQAARRVAELEKLVNRDRAITAEEMSNRAAADALDSELPAPGPDQGVLLSPASQLGTLGASIRKSLGIKNSNVGDVVALRRISLNMAEALGVPIREGRGNLARMRALGAFWVRPEIIRVRRLKGVATVAHEVAHYLDKKYGIRGLLKLTTPAERKPISAELIQMGKNLYKDRKPNGGYASEGVAEWGKFFVTDPQRMIGEAPAFSRYMDKLLERETGLRDILLKGRDDFARFEAAPANAKIATMIQRKLPSRFSLSPEDIIDEWFNDLTPIRRAQEALGKPGNITKNAATLAHLTKGNAGRGRDMIHEGVIDFNTRKRVTRGLRQILQDVGEKDRDAFTEYITARQVLTKTGQGIDTGFDVQAAKDVVAAGSKNPVWVKAADEVWGFRSALLDYLEGAGLLTKEAVKSIRDNNPTPTPFYRYFEPEEGVGRRGGGAKLARASSGVQKMVGGDRPIIDPLESIVSDAYDMVDRAHKHWAATTLLKAAISTEGGARIATVLTEAPKELRSIAVDRVRDQLEAAGWLPPNAGPSTGILEAFYEKRSPGAREARDMVMPVLIDGERKWIQVNDRATWEAIQSMSITELKWYDRYLTAPTRTLRMGATQVNPDFTLVNPFRDAFPAAIYSEGPTRLPGYHIAHGIAHLLKSKLGHADALVARWAQEGGENAGLVGGDTRAMSKHYQATVRDLMASPTSALKNAILSPIRTISEAFQLFENGTRVGLFADIRADELKKGASEIEASMKGAIGSREGTQDFFVGGRTARVVNRYVPFFMAQLGELRKLSYEFDPRKLNTPEGRKRMATVTARATAFITIPSVSLYLLQKDDPAYQEIPEYYKASAWILIDRENGPIPWTTQSGEHIRVWVAPRPHLLGFLFGYAPEKLLASVMGDDPDALSDLGRNAWAALTPPIIPALAGPLLENYANKSTFTKRPIVPPTTADLDPAEQVAPHTGESARLLGDRLGYSPAKIENLVRGWTGGAGVTVREGADALVREVREKTGAPPLRATSADAVDPLDRKLVIGRFILPEPGANSKSVSKVFSDFQSAESRRRSLHRKIKEGRMAEAKLYFEKHKDEIMSVATKDDVGDDAEPGELRAVRKAMGDLTAKRREMAASNSSSLEKAVTEREIGREMVELARAYYKGTFKETASEFGLVKSPRARKAPPVGRNFDTLSNALMEHRLRKNER